MAERLNWLGKLEGLGLFGATARATPPRPDARKATPALPFRVPKVPRATRSPRDGQVAHSLGNLVNSVSQPINSENPPIGKHLPHGNLHLNLMVRSLWLSLCREVLPPRSSSSDINLISVRCVRNQKLVGINWFL